MPNLTFIHQSKLNEELAIRSLLKREGYSQDKARASINISISVLDLIGQDSEKYQKSSNAILLYKVNTVMNSLAEAKKRVKEIKKTDILVIELDCVKQELLNFLRVVKDQTHTKVIVFFNDLGDENLLSCFTVGVKGFAYIKEGLPRLFSIISIVEDQGGFVHPKLATRLIDKLSESKKCTLSKREIEILNYCANGNDYKQISKRLVISPFTVRAHLRNIYDKLNVKTKLEAIIYAYKANWI